MQVIKTEIKIPKDLVLIERTEYQLFLNQQLEGRVWNMKQLEERTNRSGQWLKKNVLEVPAFKQELEKFVNFPRSKGEPWKFGALRMGRWLEENQHLIFK